MTRQNTLSVYRRILKQWPLYLMMVPGLAYLLINNYLPLAGLQLAFKKFKYALGIWKSDFNNFKNFTYLFKSSDAWIIIRNTVGYNLIRYRCGYFCSDSVKHGSHKANAEILSDSHSDSASDFIRNC